ncbi:hypothetical protein [Chitinimonas lacunae]|uniref:Two-component sensor histidine kinase n=1 Tax=Chitinimonas lacunae TaxID=1963018 RepID=A0ABV8MT81_9NEIS
MPAPQAATLRLLFLPLLAFLGVFLGLTLLLIGWRVEQVALELAHTRSGQQAVALREQIEAGFRLGLQPADMTRLAYALHQLRRDDPGLAAALLTDPQGRPFVSLDGDTAQALLQQHTGWRPQLLRQRGVLQRQHDGYGITALRALDASGQTAVLIWLVRDDADVRQRCRDFLLGLLPWGAALLVLLTAAGTAVAARLLRRSHRPPLEAI